MLLMGIEFGHLGKMEYRQLHIERPLKKRCRILPARGLGVSPSFKISPKHGGYRGLIESISAVSYR